MQKQLEWFCCLSINCDGEYCQAILQDLVKEYPEKHNFVEAHQPGFKDRNVLPH